MHSELFAGDTLLTYSEAEVRGSLETQEGEIYYRITDTDHMRPFFMSLVSDGNHWMFLSSNGALTAGRKNSEFALFPYYTDDKITESLEITGCKTIVRHRSGSRESLWEPFSERYAGVYRIRRNLYKNVYGNKIIFEEENHDLGLTFRYQWSTSARYGFVRRAFLLNTTDNDAGITLLDGLQNLLPHGITSELQNTRSNLVDAYKKSELLPEVGLGIYALSAIIVDRAEPSEALKANTVWSAGVEDPTYLLSSLPLDAFRRGEPMEQQTLVKGEKGAYFISTAFTLEAGASRSWMMVANVNQGPSGVIGIREQLRDPEDFMDRVEADVKEGTKRLIQLTTAADGMQHSADMLRCGRHYANVMYNIMRGGIMDDNYTLEKADFAPYIRRASKAVYERQKTWLEGLPDTFTLFRLLELSQESGDAGLQRLSREYLPLKFSRRHGDPSRPWNKFSINTQSEVDGSKILDYQGNWRDIFQNWEALAHSYPEYIDGMIHKFLNASTADGYNPYRITKDGIDWEVIEPDDPWSYIGYWGDHQIIYLLKFLEFAEDYFPGRLMEYWGEDLFVYANVPYRIRPYAEILKNPKDTIDFDAALDRELRDRRARLGADGFLVLGPDQSPYRVNLLEKFLAMLLAKISNFIPEAGIWLNTQRPEWNDANNALVGNGVSMVTLYYLHRFLEFMHAFLERHSPESVLVSKELAALFKDVDGSLDKYRQALGGPIPDDLRKQIVDALGEAAGVYREGIYNAGFSGEKVAVSTGDLMAFVSMMLEYTEHSMEANRREDGLFHAYNLISLREDGIGISYLSEMLEGQVAVLSSGYLSPEESLALLKAMRNGLLYREDQNSYMLYPDRDLPSFVEKNCIPRGRVQDSELLKRLSEEGNTQVIERDETGAYHFNGAFNNASKLSEALSGLPQEYQAHVREERDRLLQIYEEVFDHRSFTGRSGTFFAYEGLGSIYWHMVSKLALAVQETCLRAMKSGSPSDVIEGLLQAYHEVNAGIGVHKSPGLYGAFPTDPYSHTPAHRGAQQPGMTGQVKEDILTRRAELGLHIASGEVAFGPYLFQREEFIEKAFSFPYVDIAQRERILEVPGNSLVFMYGQVPIVYSRAEQPYLEAHMEDGSLQRSDQTSLGPELSKELFRRTGSIHWIRVGIVD